MTQREWADKDYYADLGVSKSAGQEEIKKAYRTLAKKHHPDRHPGDPEAEARFKEISEAHDVLADPEERQQYDQIRAMGSGARFAGGVGNGLDALSLGLRALGVGPGDEVLVPSHTFVATWLAVAHVGAVPVPVDVRSASADWDEAALVAAVVSLTHLDHLYGPLF